MANSSPPPVFPGFRSSRSEPKDGFVPSAKSRTPAPDFRGTPRSLFRWRPGPSTHNLARTTSLPFHLATDTRYTMSAPSSDTSSAPSGATATPTGRPYTSDPRGSGTKPVRKGTGYADGLPSLKATNATWYPERAARFHEPCSAMNAPPQ